MYFYHPQPKLCKSIIYTLYSKIWDKYACPRPTKKDSQREREGAEREREKELSVRKDYGLFKSAAC